MAIYRVVNIIVQCNIFFLTTPNSKLYCLASENIIFKKNETILKQGGSQW